MTTQELDQIKASLISKKQLLSERLDKIKADVRHQNEPVEKDFAEQATQRENDEVIDAIGNESAIDLKAIDRAIERIDEGIYLECDQCGEEIETARLKALPEAIHCIKCASAIEQHQQS